MAGPPTFAEIHKKINDTITVYSDKKVQFRDTGIYIQSSADGKLKLSADGTGTDDITLSGSVKVTDHLTLASGKNIIGSGTGSNGIELKELKFYNGSGSGTADRVIKVTLNGTAYYINAYPAYS